MRGFCLALQPFACLTRGRGGVPSSVRQTTAGGCSRLTTGGDVCCHRITPRSTNKVSPESTPRGGGADSRLDDTALSVASLPPPTLENAGIGFSVTPVQPSPILAPQGVTTPSQASASSASYARPPVGLPLSSAWPDAADKEEAREERAEVATERAGGAQDSAVAKHQDSANAKISPDANLSARASGPTCVDPCALMTSCPIASLPRPPCTLLRKCEEDQPRRRGCRGSGVSNRKHVAHPTPPNARTS